MSQQIKTKSNWAENPIARIIYPEPIPDFSKTKKEKKELKLVKAEYNKQAKDSFGFIPKRPPLNGKMNLVD